MRKLTCETDGCDEEISEGCGSKGGLPICSKCRSVRYYWRAQGPKAFENRRATLSFWQQRCDYLAPHVGRLIKDAQRRVEKIREHASRSVHH